MELIIFRNKNINLFQNQIAYRKVYFLDISALKDEKYGNFIELDNTKCKIDTLDKNAERTRRAAAKYLHEYELVKILCKKQVISRAYFKLYEIIYNDPIVLSENLNCFFICEAPGGFIDCILDIRRKKNLRTNYIALSKYGDIKYDPYLEQNNLLYGDVTELDTINKTIEHIKEIYPLGLDFITADGGFDIKAFNSQEILSSKLLLCEIYIALKTQKKNGMFIIKFFDMFTHNSIVYYLLLCSFYSFVKIIKPKTSRNCNSERYLVCYEYKGEVDHIDILEECIKNFEQSDTFITILYPDLDTNVYDFVNKIKTFNNLILYEQIKTINESLKMVQNKNIYFQNLILNLFLDKLYNKTKLKCLCYKNILQSRIKKCTDFLRYYNIKIIDNN